jgi:hypothetical protein
MDTTAKPFLRTPGRAGLAAALVAGLFAISSATAQQITVPNQSRVIDSFISKSWSDNKIVPAKKANDNEFIRRVFLDLLGRIPTPEEVREFERDTAPNKRARLINRLLNSESHKVKDAAGKEAKGDDGKPLVFPYTEEYASHWADIWTVWTMTRGGTHELYHKQIEGWFNRQLERNVPYDKMVRALLTASGKGNEGDGAAANFVMAHLGEPTPNDRRGSDGPFDAIPITSRVTRLFIGIQTQCTQCHDHPFNPEWGQENFWGVNAFFRQVNRDTTPAPAAGAGKKKMVDAMPVTVSDDPKLNSGLRTYYERRTGVLMSIKPTFLPHLADLEKDKSERAKKPLPSDTTKTRREVLADYVVEHDNFAKAYVNRMWSHFFGRGMNEQPVPDDFGGHNKVIHPELLEALGQEFIKYQYDTKKLIEWICNSEAYNLSYVAPNKEMAKSDYDVFFGRMPLKAMSPEVLYNALETATRADQQVDKEARKTARETWMRKLVVNFGDDEGNEMTFNGTIVQALLMMNGKEINEEIKRSDGMVAKALARAAKLPAQSRDAYMINEIYVTALGRKPSETAAITYTVETTDPRTKKMVKSNVTTNELAFVKEQLRAARGGTGAKGAKSSDQVFFEDLLWTLLNTNEFMLNH